jgi:hypothetical protein
VPDPCQRCGYYDGTEQHACRVPEDIRIVCVRCHGVIGKNQCAEATGHISFKGTGATYKHLFERDCKASEEADTVRSHGLGVKL